MAINAPLARDLSPLLQDSSSSTQRAKNWEIETPLERRPTGMSPFPLLPAIGNRLGSQLSQTFRKVLGRPASVVAEGNPSFLRWGPALEEIEPESVLGLFASGVQESQQTQGILIMGESLGRGLVDVVFGGSGGGPLSPSLESSQERRSHYTPIEMNLLEQILRNILHDLTDAFAPLMEFGFTFESFTKKSDLVSTVAPSDTTIRMQYGVRFEGQEGALIFLIPSLMLDPIQPLLQKNFMGEKWGKDPFWAHHLTQEVNATEIRLYAILEEATLSLGEILEWTPGTHLPLTASLEEVASDLCTDLSKKSALFRGLVGQKSGYIALKINHILSREGEVV